MMETKAMERQLIDSIFESGVLIDLLFSAWTGQVQIKPEEIGLESIPKELMTLGRKRLVRKELAGKPNSIISVARSYIEKQTHPFPLSRARFIPERRIKPVLEVLYRYKGQFNQAVGSVIDEYEAEKELMLRTWREEITRHFGGRVNVDKVVESIRQSYPSINYIQRAYRFDWVFYHIKVPNEISAEIQSAKARQVMDEKMQEFIRSAVETIKSNVTDLISYITKLTDESFVKLSKKSMNKINRLIDVVSDLNFFNDSEVDKALLELRDAVSKTNGHGFLDKGSVNQAIDGLFKTVQRDIDEQVRTAIENLTGESKRAIKV